MRNASRLAVYNNSGMHVEFTLSWMLGPKGQQRKVTTPYHSNLSLLELHDDTEVTVEGKIGDYPVSLMFNYKHKASPLVIEAFRDGSHSIN